MHPDVNILRRTRQLRCTNPVSNCSLLVSNVCARAGYMLRAMCTRKIYPALLVSSEEERITCDVTHPLKDFVNRVLFRLHSCLAKLLSSKTFRCKLKLKLTLLSFQVKDTITRVMEDVVSPSLRSITGDMKENRLGAQCGGGALEVRSGGHWCRLVDFYRIHGKRSVDHRSGHLFNWHTAHGETAEVVASPLIT